MPGSGIVGRNAIASSAGGAPHGRAEKHANGFTKCEGQVPVATMAATPSVTMSQQDMDELIRKQPGVVSTRVGYTGGQNDHPTYRNHPGHAEAIEIVYDPAVTDYRALLEFFFQIHDPTTPNRQGNDRGMSYRSAIYFTSDAQRDEALDTIADVNASGLWPGKVVTEVRPAGGYSSYKRVP